MLPALRHAPLPLRKAFRALRELGAVTVSAAQRGVWRARLGLQPGSFQPGNTTWSDRYPEIFAFLQSELRERCEARILSFGCATGDEVFSLRAYFPNADITGIDINGGNIAACRQRLARNPDKGISFKRASSTRGEPSSFYDIICCNAVLRHTGLRAGDLERCDRFLRFEDFSHAVADFARCLKPGGLLMIRHSNMRFADTPTAAEFTTVFRLPPQASDIPSPIYGPDNRLIPGAVYDDTVFRKVAPKTGTYGPAAARPG